MDALEKINRDNQIVVARMRGISWAWATMAGTHGLSQRQRQKVLEDCRASHRAWRKRDPDRDRGRDARPL